MGKGNISAVLDPTVKDSIKQKIEGIKTDMPFLVNRTPAERKKMRTIGPNRLGYVTEVNLAANAHKSALAGDFDLDEFNRDKALLADMAEVFSWISPLHDSIMSTLMALGADMMQQSDKAYKQLKANSGKNSEESLNTAIKRIAAILKQVKKDDKKV